MLESLDKRLYRILLELGRLFMCCCKIKNNYKILLILKNNIDKNNKIKLIK